MPGDDAGAGQQAAFTAWLAAQGGYVNPKLNLCQVLPGGDRCVAAASDVAEGEQLLIVPVAATLHLDIEAAGDGDAAAADAPASDAQHKKQQPATCSPQLAAFLRQAPPAGQQPFSPFLATTLMLMSELAQGDASSFRPYLDTLPASTDCLLNWSPEEQQLLQGTSLSGASRSIQDIYEADIAPRLAAAPELFPPGAASSFEAFRRATDLVQTRAFHMSSQNWLTGASQESTDELYLIPAIDMLNHATHSGLRNTTLELVPAQAEKALGDGSVKTFTNFFSMRAEKAIPAGTQILHTYGDLADAQLLQTYGFIDAPPPPSSTAAPAPAAAPAAAAVASDDASTGNPHNYVVLPLEQLLQAAKLVASAAQLWPRKQADKILTARLQHLAAAGLLQADAPQDSQLVLGPADPLPDQLLTILQVLMLTADEFDQLLQQAAEEAAEAAEQGGAQPQLSLGRDMLAGEFGELCGAVLLQAVERWLQRYPQDLKAARAALAAAAPGSRPWLAAAVAVGEQQLLLTLKREAVMILAAAQEDDEDEEGSEEEAAAAAAAAAAAGGSSKKRKQPAGDAGHKHHHKHHKHHHKHQKDDRPHFGDMTGPKEKDVWQSDDSDKVGYSSGESDGEQPEPRHAANASERHTYEVGAGGAVREAHGHMLGPDEADLIESEDSGQVGYADDDGDAAGGGGGSSRGGETAAAPEAAGGARSSKRPKRGLGFKG